MQTYKFILSLSLVLLIDSANAQSNRYNPDNPNIQYMGRIDKSDPTSYLFSLSGVSIKAKFNGTEVSLILKDYATGTNTTTNYFNVFVDGERAQVLETNNTDTLYTLAIGLTDTTHDIEITKRTEVSVGRCAFKGFLIDGTIIEPDPKPQYKIEIIGDSRSAGYGNEVSYEDPNDTPGFNSVNEDNYWAWSAITARELDFEYHCVAMSGRGMYRNNTGSTVGVIPSIYDRTNPAIASSLWNHEAYTPDLIIVLLGTNDFAKENAWGTDHSDMLDSADYVGAYITFVEELRQIHGSETLIVCAFGNSISKWTPLNQLNRWRNYILAVTNNFNDAGDNRVHSFEFNPVTGPPYGEDWHPTIVSHQNMADDIIPFLEALTSITLSTSTFENTKSSMSVHPNPLTDEGNISSETKIGTWQLKNMAGITVKTGHGNSISTQDLENGIYFLQASSAKVRLEIIRR